MPFCYDCGNQISSDDNFCQKCGKKVTESESQLSQPEISQNTSDDLPNINKRKKTIYVFSAFIILIASISIWSLTKSRFDASHANAIEIANWMVENNYCSIINEERPDSIKGLEFMRTSFDKGLYRLCEIKPANSIRLNSKLEADYGNNKNMGFVAITVGSGRSTLTQEGVKFVPKYLNDVVGDNWKISFTSYESSYPGSFKLLKDYMYEIAGKLKGKVSALYRPSDYCAFVKSFNSDSALNKTKNIQAMYRDCLYYAPNAFYTDSSEIWPD